MSKYRKLIAAAIASPKSAELMQEINTIMDEHLLALEVADPAKYWNIIHRLHAMINGYHFDEAMSMYAVSELENEDGTEGAHWTEAETTSVAASEGIAFDKFNKYDWYYTLNMIYSDFYPVVGGDTSMYFRLAKAWLMDKDAPEGKAYRYYESMCY